MGRRKAASSDEAAFLSVLSCQHDRQHAHGLREVGRVFAAVGQILVVIVELPEDRADTVDVDPAEVMLPVGVIGFGEAVKCHDSFHDLALLFRGKGGDAGGYDRLAGDATRLPGQGQAAGAAEPVILFGNDLAWVGVRVAHRAPSFHGYDEQRNADVVFLGFTQ